MKIKIENIDQLRILSWFTVNDFPFTKQTYINVVKGKTKPTEKTIKGFCDTLKITEKELIKLL